MATTQTRDYLHRGQVYQISRAHPEADRYPWMEPDELDALANDIKGARQREPIKVLPDGLIVDGRNRELACLIAGVSPHYQTVRLAEFEVPGFVESANIHRRHLSRDDKQRLIARELKLNPEQSNSAIAAKVGVTDKTVAPVRAELESTSEIPKLDTTRGRDGRKRKKPAPKPKAPKSPPPPAPEPPGEPDVDETTRTDTAPPVLPLAPHTTESAVPDSGTKEQWLAFKLPSRALGLRHLLHAIAGVEKAKVEDRSALTLLNVVRRVGRWARECEQAMRDAELIKPEATADVVK